MGLLTTPGAVSPQQGWGLLAARRWRVVAGCQRDGSRSSSWCGAMLPVAMTLLQ